MKYTAFILLALLSINAAADVEFRISDMHYKWGQSANFPLTAYQVGYSRYFKNTGLRVMVGESSKRKNTMDTKYCDLTEEMKNFWVMNVNQRYWINSNLSVQLGLNYTEYRSCSNEWGCNPDTGTGWGAAIEYMLSKRVSVKLSYDHYYEKQHKVLGKEITQSTGISIVAKI